MTLSRICDPGQWAGRYLMVWATMAGGATQRARAMAESDALMLLAELVGELAVAELLADDEHERPAVYRALSAVKAAVKGGAS